MASNQWLFSAYDPQRGIELWTTNGTPAGTTLVKDIWTPSGYGSSPSGFIDLGNGKMLFAAQGDNTNTGRELWITNGTTNGTVMLKDLYAGATGSNPGNFIRLANGKVLFSAADATSNGNLWVTDGTAAGTVKVANIFGPSNGTELNRFTAFGNKVVFTALDFTNGVGNVMWITNGTGGGTARLHAFGNSQTPTALTDLGNGKLVFAGTDATNGTELWVSDGTERGTVLLKDINPGTTGALSFLGDRQIFALGNGRAIFRANDGTHGNELWATDGTASGTVLLADIATGTNGSNPANMFTFAKGKALFAASNGTSYGQLWVTNGTVEGTKLVKDFEVGVNGAPENFFLLPNGKVLFSGQTTNQGRELWITDGTAAGTKLVKDIASGSASSAPGNFALLAGNRVVFSADGELWTSDGTEAGTRLVVDLTPGFNNSTYPAQFTSLGNGKATFVRQVDGTNGAELWVTDGTAAGTKLLNDINPGASGSNPGALALLQKTYTITGTDANDTLAGATQTDIIKGLGGDDRLDGKGGDDQLFGGSGADTLLGGNGNDTLRGSTGVDVLTGGAGRDVFVFDSAPERDTITDFVSGTDKIRLSPKVFAGIGHIGTLTADEFWSAADATSAHDASDRVVYDTSTGVLWYDADGQGGAGAVAIAQLGATTHPTLAFSDIQIVA
ncbi:MULTISPECIES: ELWxxDGT repeat protein [Novosphingobium]|uniref:ELWxxDGT repeat protein n=1 Tax=Novosphingobium TaxID=165696 RepID=UPI001CD73577|nr:ELWxxDGT repeat protein [Novosphingobium percolationis]